MSEALEFDFSKLEILRGKTPEDIKQKCFDLCKDYLGGVWFNININEIEVKRISGGFTNQLYYCAVSKSIDSVNDEPQEVAIRLYGGKHFNNTDCEGNERLTDVIIAQIVSNNGLGPKIYGLFSGGQIQAYYKHKQFRPDEQNNKLLTEELFRKLARVHALDIPIKRTGNFLFDSFEKFYEIAKEKYDLNKLFEENNCETLMKNDLRKEIDWIKKLVINTNSPIVFCHNDFRGSNILVTESDNNNTDNSERLVLCDFEYSSYGFRGLDMGSIYHEWGLDLSDFFKPKDPVSDEAFKPFIETYISESVKIHGKEFMENKVNSVEQILTECKVFGMVWLMFFVLFSLKSDETLEGMPFNLKLVMTWAETSYKNYFHTKQNLIDDKMIENLL